MSPDKGTLDSLRIDRSRAPARSSATPWVLLAVLVLTAGAAYIAWRFWPTPAVEIRTATVSVSSPGSQRTLLNASGYVTARRQATVSSKITGKVLEVFVEEGMRVEADQILARLDASNVEASLRLAEAQRLSAQKALAETRATLQQAQREWERVRQLHANRIASQADLDRAEADATALQARLDRQSADTAVAEREVAVWQQQVDDATVRAPFGGIVTAKNAQPGEMISPVSAGGGFTRTGICTIVDMTSLEIEVDVNESYINRVQAGQPVEATLDSYPDWHLPARVIAIIPTADRQKATVKVRVGFQELDPRILPDMGVKVAFQSAGEVESPSRPLVTMPKNAARQFEGRDVVWVVRQDRAERRAVSLGETRGDDQIVLAGLNGGERVVIGSADGLAEGTRVAEKKP